MSDEANRRNLAALVVEALEVGTGKNERDVIDDLFAAFGLNFAALDRSISRQTRDRTEAVREAAARQLAGAAPTAGALLNEVVRCGGRFVAMIDDVYRHLARHATTTTGTNDTFRFQRADVDEDQLVISPEFIERIRKLERQLTAVEFGRIDHAALQSFVGNDNGEFYGTWPLRPEGGIRLLDGLLALAWVGPEISARAAGSAAWEAAAGASAAAAAAGERLVTVAQWLVRAHMTHLDVLPSDTLDVIHELFAGDVPGWVADEAIREVRRFRTSRILITEIEDHSGLGLDDGLQPVFVPQSDSYGTTVGALAGFVAGWRLGRWSSRSRRQLERELLSEPAALTRWLTTLTEASQEAADWLASGVFQPIGSVELTELLESVQEFLNLPLWRRRQLLYEVWVLFATIDACEQNGWVPHLIGAPGADGIWTLSKGSTNEPACHLVHGKIPALKLDVWREPRRETVNGVLTPDVTVSTPPPHSRDLVVVEAKDRVKMVRGRRDGKVQSQAALSVADRYAVGLRADVTWVVNHCDYRQRSNPEDEYGTVWAKIRLADQFRPGNIPSAFTESLRVATTPPGATARGPVNGLVLVVDRTKSMTGRLAGARELLLNGVLDAAYDEFRVIAYTDHNRNEPFLVRSLGPFPHLADALVAAEELPEANGGDVEEALEDAMQRCRELVIDVGPRTVLVMTDAPAHATNQCPYGIDIGRETQHLLDQGCRLFVADDWRDVADPSWSAVAAEPGFASLPLAAIVTPHHHPTGADGHHL
ncbi:hypothetical protein [Amycolatopsis sp. cmx-4-61]|uniref:hypothetical protein n=1 Tax=Amycolatopsis sp. cmx-4-61 TaxID=2790937 RepID=UPI00397A2464